MFKKPLTRAISNDWPTRQISDFRGKMRRKFILDFSKLYFDCLSHFKEFLMSISLISFGDLRKKLELAFKIYDINQSGSVNKKEMMKNFALNFFFFSLLHGIFFFNIFGAIFCGNKNFFWAFKVLAENV